MGGGQDNHVPPNLPPLPSPHLKMLKYLKKLPQVVEVLRIMHFGGAWRFIFSFQLALDEHCGTQQITLLSAGGIEYLTKLLKTILHVAHTAAHIAPRQGLILSCPLRPPWCRSVPAIPAIVVPGPATRCQTLQTHKANNFFPQIKFSIFFVQMSGLTSSFDWYP